MSKLKLGIIARPEDEALAREFRVINTDSEISIICSDMTDNTTLISHTIPELGDCVLFKSVINPMHRVFMRNPRLNELGGLPMTIATVVLNPPLAFYGEDRSTGFSDIRIISVYMITAYSLGGWAGGDANPANGIHTGKKYRFLVDKKMSAGSLLSLIATTFGVSESSIQTQHGCPLVYYNKKSYYDLLPGTDGSEFELTSRELENKGLPNIWRAHPEGAVKIQRDTDLFGCGVNETGLICCQAFRYPY